MIPQLYSQCKQYFVSPSCVCMLLLVLYHCLVIYTVNRYYFTNNVRCVTLHCAYKLCCSKTKTVTGLFVEVYMFVKFQEGSDSRFPMPNRSTRYSTDCLKRLVYDRYKTPLHDSNRLPSDNHPTSARQPLDLHPTTNRLPPDNMHPSSTRQPLR